jgi:hypothetical protein
MLHSTFCGSTGPLLLLLVQATANNDWMTIKYKLRAETIMLKVLAKVKVYVLKNYVLNSDNKKSSNLMLLFLLVFRK